MNECARFEALLEARVSGGTDPAQAAELAAHAEGCESCRELLALHRELEELGEEAEEPSEAALSAMSARVLAQVGGAKRRTVGSHWRTAAAAVAASVLLFAVGLALGRRAGMGNATERAGAGGVRLVDALGAEAASNRDLKDVEDSRFTYSNVSLRSTAPGRVLLDFDVTTHVRIEQNVRSPLAREVVVQALLDRSSTGARLQALSYADGTLEPKVREALIFSLRKDANLAIRLKALELLAAHLAQEDVKEAVLATLREDDCVQMRLRALDALAAHQVDHEVIRSVIHEKKRPGDEALLVRLDELPQIQ